MATFRTFARYQAHVEQVSCRWPNPNVQPLRGEENEQTNDTGGNRTVPASLHQTCFRGTVRPQGTLERSRCSRVRKRDDEIVPFETSPTQRRDTRRLAISFFTIKQKNCHRVLPVAEVGRRQSPRSVNCNRKSGKRYLPTQSSGWVDKCPHKLSPSATPMCLQRHWQVGR